MAVAGETLYRVPSLQVADPDHLPPLAELAGVEAVRLFDERAAAAQAGFALTAANAAPVAEICRRLDGIPLAIELAAARVKLLPVSDLCSRLDDRFRLLTGGSRTALPRHQTLRATLEWSFGLLSEAERVLFRRLAVFAGGWDLEAAEAVCGGAGLEGEVLDLLAGLVDKSLVVPGWRGVAGRYGLLETMRRYALERLAESGEGASLRQAHAGYFLALAERAEPNLFGPDQNAWFARLEEEHDNLREAFACLCEQDDPQPGLRLTGALWRFWEVRGHLAEGQARLEVMLQRAGATVAPSVRARALLAAGVCGYYLSGGAKAAAQLAEGLDLLRSLGDGQGMARALCYQGLNAIDRGAFAEARVSLEESGALCREIGNRQGLNCALGGLGYMAWWAGDAGAALPLLQRAVALGKESGDRWWTAWWLLSLSFVLLDLAKPDQALGLLAECMSHFRELGDRRGLSYSLMSFGQCEMARGDYESATRYLREALAVAREVGGRLQIPMVLLSLGALEVARKRPVEGLRLVGAAAATVEASGFVIPKGLRTWVEQAKRAAAGALGPAEAAAARSQGAAMPIERVILEVLEEGNVRQVDWVAPSAEYLQHGLPC